LAGKIAGIFPITIGPGPGSGKYSGFCPDPDSAEISGNGIPISRNGFGKSGNPDFPEWPESSGKYLNNLAGILPRLTGIGSGSGLRISLSK
jgi:hypothetical protein